VCPIGVGAAGAVGPCLDGRLVHESKRKKQAKSCSDSGRAHSGHSKASPLAMPEHQDTTPSSDSPTSTESSP
jgi:hypothetical protein